MLKNVISTVLCAGFCCAFGEDQASEESLDMKVKMAGYFIWDAAYVGEMENAAVKTYKSEPFTDIMGGLRLTAHPTDNLMLTVNPEMKSHYAMPMRHDVVINKEYQNAQWTAYMEEAKAEWTFGDVKRPFVTATLGYMIYKDNPDGRIFGDYLFRSMIYPGLIFTKFNYPQTQIFGLALKNNLAGGFSHNLFLLSETKFYPFFDLSLAYTANYSYKNMVEVGAGANFRSLIPIRPSKTTPHSGNSLDNIYKEIPLQNTILTNGDTVIIAQIPGMDSTIVTILTTSGVNPAPVRLAGIGAKGWFNSAAPNPANQVISDLKDPATGKIFAELNAKETVYSFAGTLVTARIAVNGLGFMENNPLGRDALKVYLEIAILGLKDYPGYYEKKSERMPVMFGINLPTFNILDFLSAEIEYYPSKLLPSYEARAFDALPLPGTHHNQLDNAWRTVDSSGVARNSRDDFHWGLAAKKSFRGFSLVAQVGSDHTRMEDNEGAGYYEMFTRPAHWYAQFRFIGGIY